MLILAYVISVILQFIKILRKKNYKSNIKFSESMSLIFMCFCVCIFCCFLKAFSLLTSVPVGRNILKNTSLVIIKRINHKFSFRHLGKYGIAFPSTSTIALSEQFKKSSVINWVCFHNKCCPAQWDRINKSREQR